MAKMTKAEKIEKAKKLGALLTAALDASQARADTETEVAKLLEEPKEAEQMALKALYEESLVPTRKGLEPDDLRVTVGKGRDARKVIYRPWRKEVKKRNGRQIIKEQATDADGNPLVDGDDNPIMKPVILRVEYGLTVIEPEKDSIEIKID